MIGTEPSPQQFVIGRIVRMAAAGLTGAVAALGMLGCILANLRPRQTSGCIVEPGPEPVAYLMVIIGAGLAAALLACARTTTAGLVASVMLGAFAFVIGAEDEYAACWALLLAGVLLVGGVAAKCIEEFPTVSRAKSD